MVTATFGLLDVLTTASRQTLRAQETDSKSVSNVIQI